MVTLYRAPRSGKTMLQLSEGWTPDVTFAVVPPGFTPGEMLSETIFLTMSLARARSLADRHSFDGRVLAVEVDDGFLENCIGPDPDDDDADIQVPFEHLEVLNSYPRRIV